MGRNWNKIMEQDGKDEIKIKIGQLKKCSTVRFWESIWSDKKDRKKTEGQVLRYQLIDFIYAESTLITSAQFSQHWADHLYFIRFTVRTLDRNINVINLMTDNYLDYIIIPTI